MQHTAYTRRLRWLAAVPRVGAALHSNKKSQLLTPRTHAATHVLRLCG